MLVTLMFWCGQSRRLPAFQDPGVATISRLPHWLRAEYDDRHTPFLHFERQFHRPCARSCTFAPIEPQKGYDWLIINLVRPNFACLCAHLPPGIHRTGALVRMILSPPPSSLACSKQTSTRTASFGKHSRYLPRQRVGLKSSTVECRVAVPRTTANDA